MDLCDAFERVFHRRDGPKYCARSVACELTVDVAQRSQ
jgi:hypothetical protein